MSQHEKPIIDEIILVTGEKIEDARLQIEAQRLPGFIAIESQQLREATEYISHSAILSFTIRNEELMNTSPAHYFTPEQKIKLER